MKTRSVDLCLGKKEANSMKIYLKSLYIIVKPISHCKSTNYIKETLPVALE